MKTFLTRSIRFTACLRQSRNSAARAASAAAFVVSLLVALAVPVPTAGAAGARGAETQASNLTTGPASSLTQAQASNRMWFWSRARAEQTLRRNGLRWSNAYDEVRGVTCAGLGKWIVSGGVAMFRDFHCYIRPQDGVVYKIVFHVVDERTYRIIFARYETKVDWVWPPQYAADTLVRTGIQWRNGLDNIVASSCAAFGPSSRIRGALYWALFYCTVRPARGLPYGVVLDVIDQFKANVSFVTYTDELPATPAVRTPAPSSNTTNQKLVNQIVNNQLALNIVQQGIKHQNQIAWGNSTAPDGISIMLGAVGCASDPFSNHPWKSYGSC